jgi:hypothetical protein
MERFRRPARATPGRASRSYSLLLSCVEATSPSCAGQSMPDVQQKNRASLPERPAACDGLALDISAAADCLGLGSVPGNGGISTIRPSLPTRTGLAFRRLLGADGMPALRAEPSPSFLGKRARLAPSRLRALAEEPRCGPDREAQRPAAEALYEGRSCPRRETHCSCWQPAQGFSWPARVDHDDRGDDALTRRGRRAAIGDQVGRGHWG